MKKSRFVIAVLFIILAAACVSDPQGTGPQETGTLKGHVTIGPLVPVLREGVPEPTPAPEVYEARKIVIYDESGDKEIAQVDIGPDGNYQVTLTVGIYTVGINSLGIDSAAGLPAQIEILAGQTLTLDIDIDTGIR